MVVHDGDGDGSMAMAVYVMVLVLCCANDELEQCAPLCSLSLCRRRLYCQDGIRAGGTEAGGS